MSNVATVPMVSSKTEMMIKINQEWVDKIKFSRLHEDKDGFQRPWNIKRSREIVDCVNKGGHMPPIFIAKVNGELFLLDGQHRLEAWKMHNYPLYGLIKSMSADEMRRNFVEINTKAVSVSLGHRLTVDASPMAEAIRRLAKKYDVGINRVYHLMTGVTLRHTLPTDHVFTSEDISLADTILKIWTNHRKWTTERTVNDCYNAPGILKFVGRMIRKLGNPEKNLVKLQNLDYTRGGPIFQIQGTSNASQSHLVAHVYKFVFDRF